MVFETIIVIAPKLDTEEILLLYNKIKQIPQRDYDEMILKFLKDFTECAHHQKKYRSRHQNMAFDDDEEEEEEFKKEMEFFSQIDLYIDSDEDVPGLNTEEQFGLPLIFNICMNQSALSE